MAGTPEGARKTRDILLARDPDYYRKLPSMGGKSSKSGGFASDKTGKDGFSGKERAAHVSRIRKR